MLALPPQIFTQPVNPAPRTPFQIHPQDRVQRQLHTLPRLPFQGRQQHNVWHKGVLGFDATDCREHEQYV